MDKSTVFTSFFWRYGERILAQGISFVVSIVLARILDPSVYGTVALCTVFLAILQVFIDSGLGSALIQKLDADDLDFSTVFFFNMGMCITLYIILWFTAPYIAEFYENAELTSVIRVIGLTLIISGVKGIQQAYVSRNMLFRLFFWSTLGGTLFSAVVGIFMAYKGYGVWSLVAQNLTNATIDTIILWITVKWRPKWIFSWERFKDLFSYGWKLLVSALLDTGYNNLRALLIGKLYTSEDLAYYNRGNELPNVVVTNINTSIDSVLLPAMSSAQESKEQVKSMTRRSIKTGIYLLAPIMIGLAFLAEPIVKIVLTEKWLPCVPYLQIFCITYMFFPIHTANLNAIKAMGRSDLFLKLEIIKKVVGLLLLLATMQISVMAMAYSLLAAGIFSQIINSWPNRKLLDYKYQDQLIDIIPYILLAVAMGGMVYLLKFLNRNVYFTLALQVILGVVIYVGGSVLFKIDSFYYILDIFKGSVKKQKQENTNEN